MCFMKKPKNRQNQIIAQQYALEAKRQADITSAVNQANSYFSGDTRRPYYDQAYNSAYEVNMDDLNRQREETSRGLSFQLARQSGTGTPQDAYMQDRLKQIYDMALERVGRIAESTRQGFMGADNDTRANLIGQAQSGIGANQLPQLVTSQLGVNNSQWLARAREASIGDVFSDLAKQWASGQTMAGYRSATNDPSQQEWLGTYNAGNAGGGGGFSGNLTR